MAEPKRRQPCQAAGEDEPAQPVASSVAGRGSPIDARFGAGWKETLC